MLGKTKGLRKVPLPEWRWSSGNLIYVGDLRLFSKMTESEKRASYLRSGATMKIEGILSLITISIASFASIGLTMSVLYERDLPSVCIMHSELYSWVSTELGMAIVAVMIMWFTTVRGSPTNNRWVWLFFSLFAFVDIVINIVGSVLFFIAAENLCALSDPTLTGESSCEAFWNMPKRQSPFCGFLLLLTL